MNTTLLIKTVFEGVGRNRVLIDRLKWSVFLKKDKAKEF